MCTKNSLSNVEVMKSTEEQCAVSFMLLRSLCRARWRKITKPFEGLIAGERVRWLLLVSALGCVTQTALADTEKHVAEAVQDICKTGRAEGGYTKTLSPDLGPAEIYIICVGSSSVYATASLKSAGGFASMVHITVEGDRISFLSYDPLESGSKTSAGLMPSPEFHFSIEALKRGELIGDYRSLRLVWPVEISFKKFVSFPNVRALANGSRSYSKVPGRYIIENPAQLRGLVTSPAYVRIDITVGMQRIFVSDQNLAYGLFNGLRATERENSKDVFSAISGVDDGTYGKSVMTHVRGHMLSDDEIEFYYFTTLKGMKGPFRAKRDTITTSCSFCR